ncbi:hypothetical protein BKA67DRAFT_538645 [Truncatella angustata]|uniref:G-protein coupled receptors family 2 profile 2 domain-containing protein n=1 Tax=Truncatella angustata TaxID=152316 RepID=A0A9P8ZV28_9PEZI|nr:uncharacterized protein BKA67DRAFT_538645 [Truncatella angustata]KAH6648623.1 hypothetical protein BKA67DRAFT_538645 [Truncatella angustata]KAH8196201.1 hypothetical protein TruAng_009644 [Truncatella angustata]
MASNDTTGDVSMNETAHTGLSRKEIDLIVAFERAGAGLSVFGILWIFIAFAVFKRLRTVPNTFIVFASFANLCASIACLIGYDGVRAGSRSHLCQAQAFMFELFMQSDPWWSFAMAVNVYMVFFFAVNPQSFLRYWWAYFIVCYGIPAIPSVCLLLIKETGIGPVYGNATIWCWIDTEWSGLRIWTYYLPIWRNQLRNLSLSDPHNRDRAGTRDSAEKRLNIHAAAMGSIAPEVLQTTTIHVACPSLNQNLTMKSPGAKVRWFADPPGEPSTGSGQEHNLPSATCHIITHITAEPAQEESLKLRLKETYQRLCGKFNSMDPVKLAYLRTSFIFAVSVLVTWTPSSINRVHDLVTRSSASFGLNLASSIVLPLQGLWNSVIFFTTSWKTLKEELQVAGNRLKGLPRGHIAAAAVRHERERGVELDNRYHRKCRDDASSEVTGSTMRVMRDGSLTSL